MSEMEVDPQEKKDVPFPGISERDKEKSIGDKEENLLAAVIAGDKDAVEKVLAEDKEAALVVIPDYRDYRSINLICVAAREGKDEVIDPLHLAGAKLDHFTGNGFNAFHIAARYGKTQVSRKLADLKINVNTYTERGLNAFHIAAQYDQSDALKELSNLGMDVKTFSKHGLNALHIAAQQGHSKILSDLVHLRMNINSKSYHGFNALHIAAQNGHAQVLSKLVNHGIDVNASTERGFNALHIAVQNCHTQVASALVKLGIGVNTTNAHGLKVVHLAAKYGHSQVLSELTSLGMDVNAMTSRGFNALHIAAQTGQPQILRNLVELGIDVNKGTAYGLWTPLHFAADNGNHRCVEQLVKLGANKDAKDNRNRTPLKVAEEKKQMECVRALENGGAHNHNDNIDAKDDKVENPDGVKSSPQSSYEHVKSALRYSKGPIHAFNYIEFLKANSKRAGAESDSKSIIDTFTKLGYDVHIYTNYTYNQTINKFKDLQKDPTLQALITIILSHGNDRLTFKTSDEGDIDLNNLRQLFTDTSCPTLKGRSKIFMANFCRGECIELNYDFDANSFPEAKKKLEAPHNMMTFHAATEGIMARRHAQNGTIFIHCLCNVITKNPTQELKHLFNEVCTQMKQEGGTTPMCEIFFPMGDFNF